MSRNNRVAALGLLAVLLWGAPSAVGQTAAEVERWFRQELARAATPLAGLKNIQLTYRVEKPSELTAAELAEVQREIAGKPDHPKRMIAERSERRLRDGDETERYTLYLRSPDEWRVGHDYLGTKYFDCAAVPGLVWGFSNGQLTLLDPAGGFPPARDYRELGITPKNDVARLRFGGLDLAHRWGLQITSASPQDGRWRLLASNDVGVELEFIVEWPAEVGRGFVRSVRPIKLSPNNGAVSNSEFDGWTFRRELGDWTAEKEHRTLNGRRLSATVLESVHVITDAQVTELLAPPAINGTDPVRGPVTVSSVFDYRPAEQKMTVIRDGSTLVEPLRAQGPGGPDSRYVSWLGWGVLAVLVALFLFVRLRGRTIG